MGNSQNNSSYKGHTEIKLYLIKSIVIVCIFILGILSANLYNDYNYQKKLDGLWLNGYNYSSVKEKTSSLDNSGQWVCININDEMNYEEIVNTCEHEAGHELFARLCDKEPEKCFKLMEAYEND